MRSSSRISALSTTRTTLWIAALVAALVTGQAVIDAPTASAQNCGAMMTERCNRVGPDGKGLLGGLILGAEIGFITNAIIVNAGARELDEWWAWTLFPAIGAAGGAVAGYFALEDPSQIDMMTGEVTRGFPEVAVAVFAVSMALIVPTFVGVLALTTYTPGADPGGGATSEEDEAVDDAPPEAEPDMESDRFDQGASPAQPPENTQPAATPTDDTQSAIERTLAGGPGAIRFDRGRLLLGIPLVHTADSFTPEERQHMRLSGMTDLRVPVVSGVF